MNRSRMYRIVKTLVESLELQTKSLTPGIPTAIKFNAMHDPDCAYQPRGLEVSEDSSKVIASLCAALEKCDCAPTITAKLVPLEKE